jgi:hypothetical protein
MGGEKSENFAMEGEWVRSTDHTFANAVDPTLASKAMMSSSPLCTEHMLAKQRNSYSIMMLRDDDDAHKFEKCAGVHPLCTCEVGPSFFERMHSSADAVHGGDGGDEGEYWEWVLVMVVRGARRW